MIFTVTLRFQFPAHDEKNGIVYAEIVAGSKADAIWRARKMADRDGHLGSGKGRATFKARQEEA